MKERTENWIFAMVFILIIAVQRMVDQIGGANAWTSYAISIIPGFAIDTSRYPRVVYVLVEMGMALLAVCALAYQWKRLRSDISVIGWIAGMIGIMNTLGTLHWQPLIVFALIGTISLIAGLREYGKNVAALWVELEKGIITGCLLGGSLRYGFTFGVLAVIIAWVVQDRCLWLGTLLGAFAGKVKEIGASAEH